IDIGAFEVQTRFAVAGFPATTTAGSPGSFTVTAPNADGSPDAGYTGTVHFSSVCAGKGRPGHDAARSAAQAALLRDLFGPLPFREVGIDSSVLHWNGGAVVQLAQAAYEERILPEGHLDPARLAVLADALEESGCATPETLLHLRGPGPHVRGCFVLDALLGRG